MADLTEDEIAEIYQTFNEVNSGFFRVKTSYFSLSLFWCFVISQIKYFSANSYHFIPDTALCMNCMNFI